MMAQTNSEDYREKEREAKSIAKDIAAARGIISDGILRYKKKMLHARSKKQAEDLSVFTELDGYASKRDIQDAYGWDMISCVKMDRLNALWDAREQYISAQGKFEDRVTKMLEHAVSYCGDEYADTLEEFDDMKRHLNADLARIEDENRDNSYNRYNAGL